MEENEVFDGFDNEIPTPGTAGVQEAETAYRTDAPQEESGKKDKKAKKEKKPIDPELKKLNSRKTTILTTYFIAILCLLAGLLAPLFNWVSTVPLAERMMFSYVPSMFNHMFGSILVEIPTEGIGIFKPMPGLTPGQFDFTCLIGILYTLITVISIIMFIPILLCRIGKKNKRTGATAALVIEIIALLITAAYVAYTTYTIVSDNGTAWRDYNFFIPLGGVLLMVIIQTIVAKKGIGVSKTIAVILSTIGVFALLDFAIFIPQVETFVDNLAGQLGISAGFIEGLKLAPRSLGIDGFDILLHITSFWNDIVNSGTMMILVYTLFMVATVFTLLNLVVDILGLATGKLTKKVHLTEEVPDRDKKTGKIKTDKNGKDKMKRIPTDVKVEVAWNNPVSNTFAIVRYVLTLVVMIAILLIGLLWKDNGNYNFAIGLYFYLLLGVLVLSLFNASIRTGVANAKRRASEKANEEKYSAKSSTGVSFVGEEQSGDSDSLYGNQQYTDQYNQYNQYNFYGQYGEPQQPAYPAEQPAPAPAPEQPVYEEPAPEQTSYAQEAPVGEQQSFDPYYSDYPAQDGYAPYADNGYADRNDYSAPAYQAPVYEEPVQVENPFDVNLDEAPAAPVSGNYNGPTDAFMDTLTDDEKVEFVDVFVDKTRGAVKSVPDYVIGEDNSDFFPMVFVHINRYRNNVSDGLMSKMYKQLVK